MIGYRIKKVRLEQGHTQESLAEMINSSVRQISRYETDEGLPSIEMIIRLARALDVSADYLIGISETPHPYEGSELTSRERRVIEAMRDGQVESALRAIVTPDIVPE